MMVKNRLLLSRVLFLSIVILSSFFNIVGASIHTITVNAGTAKYILSFIIIEEGDSLQCRFSLQDADYVYTSAEGSVNIKIYDSRDILLCEKTYTIKKSDFKQYTLLLTGEEFLAYVWSIPLSDIDKGIAPGKALLTFTSGGLYWEIDNDWITIPEYSEEEIEELYENQYQLTKIDMDEIITKGSFKITLLSLGKYTYRTWSYSEEETYLRVDLQVRNIGSQAEYLWVSSAVIIDDIWNQYDYQYGGTLELDEIYPGVIRTGYILFPMISEEASTIRLLITKSSYPEDTVWEFVIDATLIEFKDSSTITISVSPSSIIQGELHTVTGSIRPEISDAIVEITFTRPDDSVYTQTATTDSTGKYTYKSRPETQTGQWQVRALWDGNSLYYGATSQSVTFYVNEAPPKGSLEIYVEDNHGNTIQGTEVSSTSEPSGQNRLSGTTNSNGLVIFSDVAAGSYSFQASKNGYVTGSSLARVTAGGTLEIRIIINPVQTTQEEQGRGIPGFPLESILIGGVLGAIILFLRIRLRILSQRRGR